MIKRRNQRGQSLVEFALIVPLLLLFSFAVIDAARIFVAYAQSANQTRQALRYAATFGYEGAAVQNFRNCEQINDIAVVNFFSDGPMTAEVTYERDGGTQFAECNTAALGGDTSQYPAAASIQNGDRVRVRVTGTVTPITPVFFNVAFPIEFDGRRTVVRDIILDEPSGGGGSTGGGPVADCETDFPLFDDGDTLDNNWELNYFTITEACNNSETDDPDDDGCDNECEETFGGDPTVNDNTGTETINIPATQTTVTPVTMTPTERADYLYVDWGNPSLTCRRTPLDTNYLALEWPATTINGQTPSGYALFARVPSAPQPDSNQWRWVGDFPGSTTSCEGTFDSSASTACFNTAAGQTLVDPQANIAIPSAGKMREIEYRVEAYASGPSGLVHFDSDGVYTSGQTGPAGFSGYPPASRDAQMSFLCDTATYRNDVASYFQYWNENSTQNEEYSCRLKTTGNPKYDPWPSFTWEGTGYVPSSEGWVLQFKVDPAAALGDNSAWVTVLSLANTDLEHCGLSFDETAPYNGTLLGQNNPDVPGCFLDVTGTNQEIKTIKEAWDYLGDQDSQNANLYNPENFRLVPVFNGTPIAEFLAYLTIDPYTGPFICTEDDGVPSEFPQNRP